MDLFRSDFSPKLEKNLSFKMLLFMYFKLRRKLLQVWGRKQSMVLLINLVHILG